PIATFSLLSHPDSSCLFYLAPPFTPQNLDAHPESKPIVMQLAKLEYIQEFGKDDYHRRRQTCWAITDAGRAALATGKR
ncbi:MAG: hypothetical protein ACYDBJ_29335, partial [Aggregatilineales bacterium]